MLRILMRRSSNVENSMEVDIECHKDERLILIITRSWALNADTSMDVGI